jgi:NAD(P)-dependent dehydrogenase (short-subunit alcohol dehydrogenase family)
MTHDQPPNRQTPDMTGKVVVITGGTSGIGRAAATRLASAGARIVLVARAPERARQTIADLDRVSSDGAGHSYHVADLALVANTVRVADRVARAEPRIDVLVNNAGGLYFSRETTAEGLERTFALNHMSYFLMADGLLGSLAPGSRIVNTASEAHRAAPGRLDDLPDFADSGFRAYARTKAFNVLFTRALARRVEANGIAVHCFHPGLVRTRLFGNHGFRARALALLARTTGVSVEKGADTLVYLATTREPGLGSGRYYSNRRPRMTAPFAESPDAAERLWVISEQIRDRFAPLPA